MPFKEQYVIKRPFAVRIGDTLFFHDSKTMNVLEAGFPSQGISGKTINYFETGMDLRLYGHVEERGISRIAKIVPGDLIKVYVTEGFQFEIFDSVGMEHGYLRELEKNGTIYSGLPGIFLHALHGSTEGGQEITVEYKPVIFSEDAIKPHPEELNFDIDAKDIDSITVLEAKNGGRKNGSTK